MSEETRDIQPSRRCGVCEGERASEREREGGLGRREGRRGQEGELAGEGLGAVYAAAESRS